MKALTLRQPHVELILAGVRCEVDALGEPGSGFAGACFETRSWPTALRGRIALHAGARFDVGRTHVDPSMEAHFARSAIVGTCQLVGCCPIVEHDTARARSLGGVFDHRGVIVTSPGRAFYYRPGITRGEFPVDISRQLPFGRFEPRNFAWLLADVQRTTTRCPTCWGTGRIGGLELGGTPLVTELCRTCVGAGQCDPIPAAGRQGLWSCTHLLDA